MTDLARHGSGGSFGAFGDRRWALGFGIWAEPSRSKSEPRARAPRPTPVWVKNVLRVIARVVRVIDGDTIEVSIFGRDEDVRYIGVDTPETVKPDTPVQCYGPRASAENHRLVDGRTVRLVFDRERNYPLPNLFVSILQRFGIDSDVQ